jgi:hypothetical protein
MRSTGKCVRAVAGLCLVCAAAAFELSHWSASRPSAVASRPRAVLPDTVKSVPIPAVATRALRAMESQALVRTGSPSEKRMPSALQLPLVFEQNVGQAPGDFQFIGRSGGERYLLTGDGIRIEHANRSADDAISLRFVDARNGLRARGNGAVELASGPRKRKPSSKGKSRGSSKPRRRNRRRSSHPAGASQPRPRDVTPPSASETGANPTNVAQLRWTGLSPLGAETNYFLGRDPSNWHTHVANFEGAQAANVIPGIDVVLYGTGAGAEYDLRVAPHVEASAIRLAISQAGTQWHIDAAGDFVARHGRSEIRMRKPVAYELLSNVGYVMSASEATEPRRHPLASRYEFQPDGTVGFRVDGRDQNRTLVIDPALSVTYFSFLGGSGSDSAASVAVDTSGFLYVSGTTTSARTIPSAPMATLGLGGGGSDYFVAKIDPTKTGAASLVYLTFVGGSGAENGGKIAIDANGDVALVGTTRSDDYPVTDGSTLTAGAGALPVNDVTVTEIDPTGAKLLYSSIFGGNGNEGTQSMASVAVSKAGQIFVAGDTQSTNLPVAPAIVTNSDGSTSGGPFQTIYGGGASDGFLAIFNPAAPAGTSPIVYCTYLGINGQATVTGVAVDIDGNAYLAGTTTNPNGSFTATNGFQPSYGGDPTDGFVMKLLPSGNALQDLSYATYLGGSGADQALAIAVSASLPGTVYVTGSTASRDFPVNGSIAPYQRALGANGATNAFVAVITQNPTTFATSLQYSSYLGGEKSDTGEAIFLGSQGQVYVAGATSSVYFPWLNNLQSAEGATDAFVAEINTTPPAYGSLPFSTPLGGSLAAHANAVAADALGNVYVGGDSNSPDFPTAAVTVNGFQTLCQSCSAATPLSDAFVTELAQGAVPQASVAFNVKSVSFGVQPVGSGSVPPQAVAIFNRGDALMNVASIQIGGANSADFPLAGAGNCLAGPVAPNGECSLEIGFAPSVCGAESGDLTFTDDGAGSPQSLPISGTGGGVTCFLVAAPASVNFGTAPVNGASPAKQSITITNSGPDSLETPLVSVSGASAFGVAANMCGSLSPGASCDITVGFAPTAATQYAGQLSVSYTAPGQQTAQITVALSGTGGTGTPTAGVSPTSVLFPSQAVGSQAAPQTVTVANTGTAPLTITGAIVSGTGAGAFGVSTAGGGECAGTNPTVPVGSTCIITITFSPTSTGAFAATLTISDNAANSPQTIPIQGSGTSPSLAIAPTSAAFGTDTMGIESSAVPITIANAGSSTITISSVTLTGPAMSDFSVPNNCVPALGAGKSCTINVSFSPTQPGTRSATISVADSAPQSPQTIMVSGTAVQAQMTATPATFAFPSQLAGTPSAPEVFTIANTAASPAMLSVTSVSVGNSPDFQVTNGCSKPVAAGGTCSVSVVFDPSASGTTPARSGSLVIASNAGANPQVTIPLTGNAADFELGPAVSGGTTVTVTGGDTATFSLDLTSIGGFTGTVMLSCAGTAGAVLPGACAAPATVVATANGQAAFQVTVGTSPDAARRRVAGRALPWPPNRRESGVFAMIAFGLLALAMLVGPLSQRRGRTALGSAVLWLGLACSLAACGGGSDAATTDPPPASTYSLTITATSGGATRTLPLTLTVD